MMERDRHFEGFFKTADSLELYEQFWRPQDPIAAVVVVHGYAEHSGRYQWVASQLVAQGVAVYAFDLRGHGKSPGDRVFVRSFDEHFTDLNIFLQRVQDREPGKPLILLGHSMGGAIAALFTIRYRPALQGLVLSSAALATSDDISPLLVWIAPVISWLLPKLPTVLLDSRAISRDPEVVNRYRTDPLIYQGRIPARTSAEILRAIAEIQSRAHELDLPLLLLHGTADRLTHVEGSKTVYAKASARDKVLQLYDGFYHELLNEPERAQILSDITAWLRERVPVV
jgi:acylglycerol lipase